MAKVSMTVEIEFETNSDAAASTAVVRVPGDIAHSIQHGVTGMLKIGMMNLGYNIRRWFRSSVWRQRLLERTESIRRLCGVENTGEVGWTTWAAPARCRLFFAL